MFLSSVFRILLVLTSIVGYGALIIGTPIGIILFILNLVASRNGKPKKYSKKTVLILVLAGPVLLMGSFILWAIVQLVSVFFGVGLTPIPTP